MTDTIDFDDPVNSLPKITNNIIEEAFGRSPAQFISRLKFFLSNPKNGVLDTNGRRWIYQDYNWWGHQLKISPRQFRRNVKKLRELNVLLVEKFGVQDDFGRLDKSVRTNYYSIDMEVFQRFMGGAESLIRPPSGRQKTSLGHSGKQKSKYDPPPDDAETFIRTYEEPQKHSLGHPESKRNTKNPPCEQHNSSLGHTDDGRNVHEDKMSHDVGQNVLMYIHRNHIDKKLINKLINKNSDFSVSVSVSMLDTWNRFVPLQRHEWSERVHHKLVWALEELFGGDVARWNTFCRKVSNSPYHRGDVVEDHAVFKFDFLKNSLCEKVLAQIAAIPEPEETLDDAERICYELAMEDIEAEADAAVKAFREAFVSEHGARKYKSWMMANKVQISCKDGIIVVRGIGHFTQDYIAKEFELFIRNYNSKDSPPENTPVKSFKHTASSEVNVKSINSPSGHSKPLGSLLNEILKKEGKSG